MNIIFALLALAYLAVVLEISLGASALRTGGGGICLTPFGSVRKYLSGEKSAKLVLINYIGNILLFLPFGILIPSALKKPTFLKTLLWGLFLTLGVETAQYFTARGYSDIDDVLMNLSGVVAGYLIFLLLGGKKKTLLSRVLIIAFLAAFLYGSFVCVRRIRPQMLPPAFAVYNNSISGLELGEYDLTAKCVKMSHGHVVIDPSTAEDRSGKKKEKAEKAYLMADTAILAIKSGNDYRITDIEEMIKTAAEGNREVMLWFGKNERIIMAILE